MIQSEKKLKELNSVLDGKNKALISTTIASLRVELPFSGAVGILVSYYDSTDDQHIKGIIKEFMNDIKDPAAREEVIAETARKRKQETLSMLISSCWQSGLDYSDYVSEIASVFISGDYATSIECFTVIEESAQKISDLKKNEIIGLIRGKIHSYDYNKKTLAQELILVLSA